MTVGTALVSGNEAGPELAAAAVVRALDAAGLSHAKGILLLLTPEFARGAAAAVQAASRAGNCLQVAGGLAAGVASEQGWVIDRPAAAAMVLGDGFGLGPVTTDCADLVCFAAEAKLPPAWRDASRRCGLLFQDPIAGGPGPVWQQARLTPERRACVAMVGARAHVAVATGLRPLGPTRRVAAVRDFDLQRLDELAAADALRRDLPAEQRHGRATSTTPPQHVWAMIQRPGSEGLPDLQPIVSSNSDGSLTLGDRIPEGASITFAIRQPIDAEREMLERLSDLSARCRSPRFGLFLSCIGRGPYFYGSEDRDWQLLRERFPDMPFIGGYGSAQIAPVPQPRALQHCVVIAAFD